MFNKIKCNFKVVNAPQKLIDEKGKRNNKRKPKNKGYSVLITNHL